jgi:hypothetical protein
MAHIRVFWCSRRETIVKVAILFRNGSGSLVQRNSDGTDMYQTVYTYSLAMQYTLPVFQPTYLPILFLLPGILR